MTCTTIGCDEPPVVLIRSEGMTDIGIQLFVLWSGWDRIEGDLYCAEHAGKMLAGLPSLRPAARPDGGDGQAYAHG